MKVRTFVYVFIFLFLINTVSSLHLSTKDGKSVTSVKSELSESFCLPLNLEDDEFEKRLDGTIFWINLNKTFHVENLNDESSSTVCAPVTIIKNKSKSNCWKLIVHEWAYSLGENNTLILQIPSLKKSYNYFEYDLNPLTKVVTIFCVEGAFQPCLTAEKSSLKLALEDATLERYQMDNSSLRLYEINFGLEYISYKTESKHNPWVCFGTTSPSAWNECVKVIYNETEFEKFTNNSIKIRQSGKIYGISEFDILSDGRVALCVKFKDDNRSQYSFETGVTTFVALSISLIGLTLYFLAFLYYKELRTFSRKVLLFFSVALFCAQLCFMLRVIVHYGTTFCLIIGVCSHFFFLAAFFWMGVIAYDVSTTILKTRVHDLMPSEQTNKLFRYSLIAWGGALLIVFVAIMIDQFTETNLYQPNYKEICWVSNKRALLLFFNSFIAVIIFINIILFSITAVYIIKTTRQTKNFSTSDNNRNNFMVFLRMALLMGLFWIFGLLDSLIRNDIVSYIYICLNAPQGLYIFICFTFMNTVKKHMKNNLCTCSNCKEHFTRSTSLNMPHQQKRKLSGTVTELSFVTSSYDKKLLEERISNSSHSKLVK